MHNRWLHEGRMRRMNIILSLLLSSNHTINQLVAFERGKWFCCLSTDPLKTIWWDEDDGVWSEAEGGVREQAE
jgi:hypothetical protein